MLSHRSSHRALSEQQIARKTLASLVSVTARIEAAELSRVHYGSGFFIAGGLIVTCHHVVAYASTLKIQPVARPRSHLAEMSSSSKETDLAVLRLRDGFVLPALELAPALPVVGEKIYVASNPRGFAGTFAAGNVSGYRRLEGGRLLMQISAPVSPGSSGGAVVNSKAQVVGIISASREDAQNLNFAVPVTDLGLAILDDLLEWVEKPTATPKRRKQ